MRTLHDHLPGWGIKIRNKLFCDVIRKEYMSMKVSVILPLLARYFVVELKDILKVKSDYQDFTHDSETGK